MKLSSKDEAAHFVRRNGTLLLCGGASLLLHAGLSALGPDAPRNAGGFSATDWPARLQVTLARDDVQPSAPIARPEEAIAPATALQGPQTVASAKPEAQAGAPSPADTEIDRSGGLDGPWYYAAKYLHRRPAPLRPIRPDYPALADGDVHTVRILLFISTAGVVDTYKMEGGESGTSFAAATIAAFTTARYTPGRIAGIPVKSQLLAEVKFDPGSGEAQTSLLVPEGDNKMAPIGNMPAMAIMGK